MQILTEIYKQLEKKDRPKEYFYVTDLGTCYRKVIMNFGSYEKKPMTNAEKIMFFKAENDHRAMARLLNKSNRFFIIREEFDISEGLPEMWHGRLDSLIFDNTPNTYLVERNVNPETIKSLKEPGGIIINDVNSIKKLDGSSIFPIDWKGTRSLKYQLELPKKNHITQLRAYIMALQNMNYDCSKGVLIYSDRTGSYEGVEFVIELDNKSVLAEMKIYEDWYDKQCDSVNGDYKLISNNSLPPILPREIKQIKNEFYLIPNWQCSYCYYQSLSCKPNMSKNKIAEIKAVPTRNLNGNMDGGKMELKIRKGYEEYEDKLNELINPKDNNDFYNFVKKESKK